MSSKPAPSVPLRQRLGAMLERSPGLKRALKRTFYWGLDPLHRGRTLLVGGLPIRVPARFAGPPWTDYEAASTRVVAAWIAKNPTAQFLDVGSSVGVHSLLALAASPGTRAWAFDSDLVSLKSTAWLCRNVGTERLRLIHGFVSARNESGLSAGAAVAATAAELADPGVSADPERGKYVCIDGREHPGTPTHSLDGLFLGEPGFGGPALVKIDVEGAEMLVLQGAKAFLERFAPALLVSVHPVTLRGFGFEPADVAAFLQGCGFSGRVLSVDHEEHWWYEPIRK